MISITDGQIFLETELFYKALTLLTQFMLWHLGRASTNSGSSSVVELEAIVIFMIVQATKSTAFVISAVEVKRIRTP